MKNILIILLFASFPVHGAETIPVQTSPVTGATCVAIHRQQQTLADCFQIQPNPDPNMPWFHCPGLWLACYEKPVPTPTPVGSPVQTR